MCLVRVFIFVRKFEHMYEFFFFFNLDRELHISLHCSYLFITTLYPFYSLSRKPNPCTPHLHRRLRTSTAELHGRWISSPPSAFEDPALDQAFVAADPSL